MNADSIARGYRWLEYVAFGFELEHARFDFLSHAAEARRVLILGEGDGRFLARLLESNRHASIAVIEASPRMIDLARPRVPIWECSRVEFHRTDAVAGCLPEGPFRSCRYSFFPRRPGRSRCRSRDPQGDRGARPFRQLAGERISSSPGSLPPLTCALVAACDVLVLLGDHGAARFQAPAVSRSSETVRVHRSRLPRTQAWLDPVAGLEEDSVAIAISKQTARVLDLCAPGPRETPGCASPHKRLVSERARQTSFR
jgi:hypothetical protein